MSVDCIHADLYEFYSLEDIPSYIVDSPLFEEDFEYISSDENIVAIDPVSKQFVAVQDGVAAITVKVKNTDLQDSFKVYAGNAIRYDVNNDAKADLEDAKIIMDCYLVKTKCGDNILAADINNDGKITMADANMLVNYINAPEQVVSSITLNQSTLNIPVNVAILLTADIAPFNAIDKSYTWSSSNASVVKVSKAGIVMGMKKGTATITCTANDGSGVKAECIVQCF